MTRLEWLETGELPKAIKNESLSWLSGLGALRHLSLAGASLGAKLADTLGGCAALRTLELRKVKLSDSAAKKLGGLKLEALGLHHAPLTDKGLAALAQLKTLRMLYLLLDGGQISDTGLAALATLPALETLHLEHWYSRGELTTLAPLAGLSGLKRLSAPRIEGSIATLAGAPALWWLSVSQGEGAMDAAEVAALSKLPNLLNLNKVNGNTKELGTGVLLSHEQGITGVVTPPMSAMC